MSGFFNLENPVFQVLGKICDMLLVSIVYILLCIPIITIGPASTALYYVMVKVIRRERGYVFREFFRSFKLNFKKGAIVGILMLIVTVILVFDLVYAWQMAGAQADKGSLLLGVFIGIAFLFICFSVYVFPILSRFDMTVKNLIMSAVFMSMRYIYFTVPIILIYAAAAVIIYYFPPFLFLAPATTVLVNSFMIEKIFKKYMPKSEGPGEQTGKDEWYLE